MVYSIDWYQEGKVILANVQGSVTLDDLGSLQEQVFAYLDNGTAPIHLIVDTTNLGQMPLKLNELRNVTRYMADDRFGWQVIVGGLNPIARMIGSILMQLAGREIILVNNMTEAEQRLSRIDKEVSLPQH